MIMKRMMSISIAAAAAAGVLSLTGGAAGPACEPGNGGITLPQGFCAAVVADNLGAARHLAVAANGDLYVSLQNRGRGEKGGVVALHDSDGDGKMDKREKFGTDGATGVALRNGYVYYATTSSIVRQKLTPGQLAPTGEPEVIAEGLTDRRQHADKGIAFDGKGGVYVNIGAPSNACQVPDRQPKVAGQDPCQLLEVAGGVWRFDENKLGQKQADGKRYATGLRQLPGLTWYDNSLWVAMHNRDSLDILWPGQFTAEQNAEWPAEYALKVGRRIELRLAVLLLQQRRRQAGDEPRVRRRRQEDRSLQRVHAADGRVPGALGAERSGVLYRHAVPAEVSRRPVRRLPRIVEPRAAADGRLQHHVRAVLRRQAGDARSVCRRLCREDAADGAQ